MNGESNSTAYQRQHMFKVDDVTANCMARIRDIEKCLAARRTPGNMNMVRRSQLLAEHARLSAMLAAVMRLAREGIETVRLQDGSLVPVTAGRVTGIKRSNKRYTRYGVRAVRRGMITEYLRFDLDENEPA